MSNIRTAVVFVALGILIGVITTGMSADEPQLETPTAAALEPVELGEVPPIELEPIEQVAPDVTLGLATSDALDSANVVYGRFVIASDEAREGVRLYVEPDAGVTVEDVPGFEWEERGRGAVIEVGAIEASDARGIVVALSLDDSSGAEVKGHVSYTSGNTQVSEDPQQWPVSRGFRDADVMVAARKAYTREALEQARELKDARKYREALETITHARGSNVEVGLALRVTSKLAVAQDRLEALEAEIEEARKPKPKARPKPKKTIEIVAGDAR